MDWVAHPRVPVIDRTRVRGLSGSQAHEPALSVVGRDPQRAPARSRVALPGPHVAEQAVVLAVEALLGGERELGGLLALEERRRSGAAVPVELRVCRGLLGVELQVLEVALMHRGRPSTPSGSCVSSVTSITTTLASCQ